MSARWRFNDGDWRARAACQQRTPDAFFPDGRPSKEPFEDCAQCPVKAQCLETALSAPWKPYGIWGGLTTRELWPMWSERHPRSRENEILQLLGLTG